MEWRLVLTFEHTHAFEMEFTSSLHFYCTFEYIKCFSFIFIRQSIVESTFHNGLNRHLTWSSNWNRKSTENRKAQKGKSTNEFVLIFNGVFTKPFCREQKENKSKRTSTLVDNSGLVDFKFCLRARVYDFFFQDYLACDRQFIEVILTFIFLSSRQFVLVRYVVCSSVIESTRWRLERCRCGRFWLFQCWMVAHVNSNWPNKFCAHNTRNELIQSFQMWPQCQFPTSDFLYFVIYFSLLLDSLPMLLSSSVLFLEFPFCTLYWMRHSIIHIWKARSTQAHTCTHCFSIEWELGKNTLHKLQIAMQTLKVIRKSRFASHSFYS